MRYRRRWLGVAQLIGPYPSAGGPPFTFLVCLVALAGRLDFGLVRRGGRYASYTASAAPKSGWATAAHEEVSDRQTSTAGCYGCHTLDPGADEIADLS